MRLFRLVPSVLLIGSAVGAASFLSRPPAPDHQLAEMTGTIATIDSLSLSVRPDDGNILTFVVDDPNSLPGGLIAGARVTVTYEARAAGGRRLVSVGLETSAPAIAVGSPLPETPAPLESALEAPAVAELPAALQAPEAAQTTPPPLQLSVPLHASAALTPGLLQAPAARATAEHAAARQCPLHLVALVLLLATGALLVISSWR